MMGMSPVAAALYLSAIGLSSRPVPLSFARTLLDPQFEFPVKLADLVSVKAPPTTFLQTLWVDDEHRLVVLPDSPVINDSPEPLHVLSVGWRRRGSPIFLGCPVEHIERADSDAHPWAYDQDGARLVRLHARKRDAVSTSLPIVELSEIVQDLVMLFDEIGAEPARMLVPGERQRAWARTHPDVSPVAVRIVEGALHRYVPWPYPFKKRTEAELRLRPRESADAVVALFDRLLDAPGPMRPTDLTAYFVSLITKRRAEFAAWPEEWIGVWGFKIKTGDHNWIEGRIWHEPGQADNPAEPVRFEADAKKIESSRYRDRYRHRVHLRTGSLRCYIERDDT